jgi:hypothetical protein
MQTTLDFIGQADTLCELFTDIEFNSTEKNTQIPVALFYEVLVSRINDCLMTTHLDNDMFITFNIVDFDKVAKERIRRKVTCERFTVDFLNI